jgi:hypothetical protein
MMDAKENLKLLTRLLYRVRIVVYGGLLYLQRTLDIARYMFYCERCYYSLPHNPQSAFLERLEYTVPDLIRERSAKWL